MNLTTSMVGLAMVLMAALSITSALTDKRGGADGLLDGKSRRALSTRETQALVRAFQRRGWFSDTWDKVKEGAENIGNHVSTGFDKLKEGAENAWDKLKENAENTWDDVKEAWEEFKDDHLPIHGRQLSSEDAADYEENRDVGRASFDSAVKRLAAGRPGLRSYIRAAAAVAHDEDRKRRLGTQENDKKKRIYYPPPDFDLPFYPNHPFPYYKI